MRFFGIILLALTLSCTKAANTVNQAEIECGSAAAPDLHLIHLFNSSGRINERGGIQVEDEQGRKLNHFVTAKACLQIPRNFEQKLIISRPQYNEGAAVYPHRLANDGTPGLFLKSYRYQPVTSSCQGVVATAASHIQWPLELHEQDPYGFAYELQISKGKTLIDLKHTSDDRTLTESVDLHSLADGTYVMNVRIKQLFSRDQLEARFTCDLIIDREAPFVSLDRDPIRLDGEDVLFLQADPGEAIRIQTQSGGSVDRLFACLVPAGMPLDSCTFEAIDGIVIAPRDGSWVLRAYAEDAAGNRSGTVERNLQVFDKKILTVRSYVDQAKLAKQSGAPLPALIASVKAYEKMEELKTQADKNQVKTQLRQVLTETTAQSIEAMFRKNALTDRDSSAIGMVQLNGKSLMIRRIQKVFEFIDSTGKIEDRIDLEKEYNLRSPIQRVAFCDSSSRLIVLSNAIGMIYEQGAWQKVDFPAHDWIGDQHEVSGDCRFIRYSVDDKRFLYDIDRKRAIDFPASYQEILPDLQILGAFGGAGSGKILARYVRDSEYKVLDLTSFEPSPLGTVLNIADITLVKRSGSGSLAVQTKDGTLHLVNADGQKTAEFPSVRYFDAGTIEDEFLLSDPSMLRVASAADGLVKGGVRAPNSINLYYLNADRNFIVALTAAGDGLKVWTRSGALFDEIYKKDDPINGLWMSKLGYFHVSSRDSAKLYQPAAGINRKIRPQHRYAVGLHFSADGQRLLFKEQQSVTKDWVNYVEHNFVSWDFVRDESTLFAAEESPSYNRSVPFEAGYIAVTRDVATYELDGHRYTAAVVKRGHIAIYDGDDFSKPIREWKVTDNWILDIAVDESKKVLATASQNGFVALYDLKSGDAIDPPLDLGSLYPVTLTFGAQGKYLFVADLYKDLQRFERVEGGSYELKETRAAQAGVAVKISPQGDLLAVVGEGSLLNVYDLDLNLKRQFKLGDGVEIGQSLAWSPDGAKVYVGLYPGYWIEIDLTKDTIFKIRTIGNSIAGNIVVSPKGDQIAYMDGTFVQVVDLNVDQMYKNACAWLKPRLPYIPDLSPEDRALCAK